MSSIAGRTRSKVRSSKTTLDCKEGKCKRKIERCLEPDAETKEPAVCEVETDEFPESELQAKLSEQAKREMKELEDAMREDEQAKQGLLTIPPKPFVIQLTGADFGGYNGTILQYPSALGKVVLLEIFTKRCPNCIRQEPEYDKFAERFGTQISTFKLDAGTAPAVAKALGAQFVPAFYIYSKEGEMLLHEQGFKTVDQLREIADRYLDSPLK